MTAKRLTLALIFALEPLSARAQYTDRLVFDGEPGESYCVLFYPRVSGNDVALDLTETAQAGRYELLATAMDEGVLSAATYTGRVYARAASGLNPTTHAELWVASLSAFRWDGDSIVTDSEHLLLTATSDAGSGTIGRALHNLRQFFGASTTGVASAAGLANAPTGGGGVGQPRVNFPPGPAFTLDISSRADGTYKATRPIRLTAGAVTNIAVGVRMDRLYGAAFVSDVGEPTVSGGSITATELGPRDTMAMIQLGGEATAGETRTVTFDVTMDTGGSGETIPVTVDIVVFP